MNGRIWLALGSLLAGIAVALGAVGTHLLRESLHAEESVLQTYDVAVRYQMAHALALILAGLLVERRQSRWIAVAAAAFLAGIVLFSGGLYLWLATDLKPFVAVVPIGGFAWIIGWLLLAIGVWTAKPAARE
jgi:uncharacterized membrane protein YgdD (TMEM256/DUF423 family)